MEPHRDDWRILIVPLIIGWIALAAIMIACVFLAMACEEWFP